MDKPEFERSAEESPESTLEKQLIEEYLASRGFNWESLRELPELERKNLIEEACRYASLKLAEVESRARFRSEIRPPRSSAA